MHGNLVLRTTAALLFCAVATPVLALDVSVPGIHGDVSRSLLGDGTGVIIGIVDSGVDNLHPTLAGVDSLGNPRMIAEANFVTSESSNTGDDVFGHGTWVASTALGSDPVYTGMAPDARYVNARVLDSSNGFSGDFQVRNGIGFAIGQGADVLNLSLNFFAPNSSGQSQLDLMVDWAAYDRGISSAVAVGNIPLDMSVTQVRGPGSAYNGVTVGRVIADLSKVSMFSAGAYTSDRRMKPDVVAPGTLLTLANDDWESGVLWDTGLNGTSFATPHVAGLMAQQIDAGRTLGWSTDPLVVKATILNSANKNVLDRDFNPWEPDDWNDVGGVATTTHPLDSHAGAGLIDGLAVAQQYLAGEKSPGLVEDTGWDLNSIDDGQSIDYVLAPISAVGSTLTATLTWYRHVGRTDDGNGIIDALDSFFTTQSLSNLDLQILFDGSPIAASQSVVDNVEQLQIHVEQPGQYTLRVFGQTVYGDGEMFALAWHGATVPEPAAIILALMAAAYAMTNFRRELDSGNARGLP